MNRDEKYMKKCLALAKKAALTGDVPVGCVVVCADKIVGSSQNRREKNADPTAHAEIEALRRAGRKLGRKNLSDCELFVTLEPCVMCAGAIVNARIARVVFGAYDARFGCCGSVMNLANSDSFNHRAEVVGGVMKEECSKILSEFFAEIRRKKSEDADADGSFAAGVSAECDLESNN